MARNSVFALIILLFMIYKMDRATADPLRILFTDQPSHIVEGSEVHLTCVVGGGNHPHTTWISPTGLLPVNSHIINGGQTLVITNYDTTDNGQYICVASDGEQFANHVFTLNVQHSTIHSTTTYPTRTHPTVTYPPTTPPILTYPPTTSPIVTYPSTTPPTVTRPSTTPPTVTRPSTTPPAVTHPSTTPVTVTHPSTTYRTQSTTHATGQFCMNCKNLISPHECNVVTTCGNHEQCYMEKYFRHNNLWYDLGCRSNVACNAINAMNSELLVGKRGINVHQAAPIAPDIDLNDDGRLPVCESCCNSTGCNGGGACGVEALKSPTIISTYVHPANYHYGDNVTITCIVASNQSLPGSTGWNMMVDPDHIPDNIALVYGINSVNLIINNLTTANIANYQCYVKNAHGFDAQTFELKPPK